MSNDVNHRWTANDALDYLAPVNGKKPPTRVERIVAAEVERIATFGWPFSALAVVVAWARPAAARMPETLRGVATAVEGQLLRLTRTLRA
jgi:hypothetical protein